MPRDRGPRIRPERVAEQLRMDVADILQNDLKDPRLGLVTCTRVDLTSDLRHAKLYVSVLGDENAKDSSMNALESATGYVRRKLSTRLGLRVSPRSYSCSILRWSTASASKDSSRTRKSVSRKTIPTRTRLRRNQRIRTSAGK